MTLLKKLVREIHDVEHAGITPKDLYNFYFLWYTAVNQPKLVGTPYGKEIMDYYLSQMQKKYVSIFKLYLAKQIAKYIQRGRVDPDFPKDVVPKLEKMSASELQALMAKTFRSDMQRRNERWDMVADFTSKLEKATSAKDKFVYINQLNNAVHNTQTRVMDKMPNYYSELFAAFKDIDKATNPQLQLKGKVDKDIRDLWDQEEQGDPHEFDPSGEGGQYTEEIMIHEGLEKILRKTGTDPNIFHQGPPQHLPGWTRKEPTIKKKVKRPEPPRDLTQPPLNVGPLDEVEDPEYEYAIGRKMAMKDKLADVKRNISDYSREFQKGYKSVKREDWWQKVNAKLTDYLARMGSSRLR